MESASQGYAASAGTGSGVMVSNLPLLFTRGFPSSLHQMKLDELEDFVPFMVRCSLGEENPVPWSQLPRPTWWPRKLPFRIPSANSPAAKRTALINLVERCYMFHGCEYLLLFCASLLESMPPTGYRFNDNRDGTTSMYHGNTGKLLVTFRNENRDYDKVNHDVGLRKKLLLSPPRVSSSGTATAVIQPAATDIYLCDKCENEFYSLREVQIHEKKCCGDVPPSPIPPSPDPEPFDDEPEPAGQVPFLAYFGLQPAQHTGIEPYMSPRKRSSSPPRKLLGPNYPRFDTVQLTSPLGRFLLQNSKFRNKHQASQHLVLRYERHLHATPHTDVISIRDRGSNRWIVVWRPNKEEQPWVHSYSFNKAHRRERRICIETGLNLRSRRLLALCHPLRVRVKRLQKRIIDRLTRVNCPSAPCIDLTDDTPKQHLHNLSCSRNILPAPAGSLGTMFNGTQEHESHQDFSSKGVILNLGASSSSWHSLNQPSALGNSTQTFPLGDSARLFPLDEYVPVQYHPGDIIKHDSISFFPLSRAGTSQNDSRTQQSFVNSASNVDHQNNKFQNASVIAPGPLCSKKSKQKLLSSNSSSLQPNLNHSHASNNSELIQVSGGNYDILNRLKGNLKETSIYAISGSGLTTPILSGESNSCQSQFKASLLVSNSAQPVPQVSESNNKVLSVRSEGNMRNSSIEVIDLSSDDDDAIKVRGYSEADNAPQQLDGVACYPHSGAQVPGTSSKYSMPKNGNSHWSSDTKSHCDSGLLGDLTTNGQPPVVLRNSADLPVPCSRFLLPSLNRPNVVEPTETTVATRKRRCEEPLFGSSGKVFILNVSKKGLSVSQQNSSEVSVPENSNPCQCTYLARLPAEVSNITLQPLDKAQGNSTFEGSKQSGAFHNNDSCYQTSGLYTSEDNLSLNLDGQMRNCNIDMQNNSAYEKLSGGSPLVYSGKLDADSIELSLSTERTSVGLIENIVNTVSKGVEFIRSLVGTGASLNDNGLDKDVLGKDMESERTTQVPKTYSSATGRALEVEKLLRDECREQNRKGPRDPSLVKPRESKVTRRSVERTVPLGREHLKAKRQSSKDVRSPPLLEAACNPHCESDGDIAGASSVSLQSVAAPLTPPASDDILSSCMDENGNSPSYASSKAESKLGMGIQYEMMLDDNMNNNNVSNSNTNDLEQNGDSKKKNKPLRDYFSTGIDKEFRNQTKVQDDNVISVNSIGLRDSALDVIQNLCTNAVSHEEFCEWKSKCETEIHQGPLHLLLNERLAGKTMPCDNSGHELWFPVETAGKTAEESGALKAEIPHSSNCTEDAKERYPFETHPQVLVQNSGRLCDSSGSLVRGKGQSRLDSEIPLYGTSEIESLNPEMIRGTGLCLGQLNLGTEVKSKQILKKGFQFECSSGNYSSKDRQGDREDGLNLIQKHTKDDWKRESTGTLHQFLGSKGDSQSILLTRSMKQKSLSGLDTPRSIAQFGGDCGENIDLDCEEKANDIENRPLFHSMHGGMDKSNGHGNFLLLYDGCTKASKSDNGAGSLAKNNHCCANSESGNVESVLEEKMDRNERLSKSNEQKRKKGYLRELNNLGCDEWKEMRSRGFHPSDLLGSDAGRVPSLNGETDESESDGQDSQALSKRLLDTKKDSNVSQMGKKMKVSQFSLTKVHFSLHGAERSQKHPLHNLHNLGKNYSYLHGESSDEDCLNGGRSSMKLYERSPKDNKITLLNQSSGMGETRREEDAKTVLGKKPRKRCNIPRELLNLGRDEWKEMRNTGFHPSDLVGSESTEGSYLIGESDEDEDFSDCTENKPPVLQQSQGKKSKMSREVLGLLKDECKELKMKKANARDASRQKRRGKGWEGGGDHHRRGNSNISRTSQYANLILNSSYSVCNSKYFTEKDSSKYANVRNTRSQTNVVSFVEEFTPRDSHRQLLHSETAMCVLNYDLPSIT